ncbi:hypothetical protein [Adhaeribacter pallidiroseus]|uniref:Uncharacterized protein n=1 Tax=Adhaeribacter pallidiroseus TaxID=2072847 RepID=A0A369QJ79_9BACT|nr:hypothetical protein [Adhaeribacter pallidiroseus]RDC63307.1 hypothetical protein AHMF7616_01909 [Adhaeribacter pallidiroseus]
MFQAIDFPQRNSFFYKWKQETIACTIPAYQDGRHIIICWQFTPEHLAQLQANGGKLYLVLNGHADLATLALTCDPPFDPSWISPDLETRKL